MSTAAPNLTDRAIRQRDLVPDERLNELTVVVVGTGAIGRQASLQLAAIGVPRLILVDFDTVDVPNLAAQGFFESDLGLPKVDAVARLALQIYPQIVVTALNDRFSPRLWQELGAATPMAVFCCVDSIRDRRRIWEAVSPSAAFFVDGRMHGESMQVLASADPRSDKQYPTSFFEQAEQYAGSCTGRSTIYCANVAAGIMVSQYAHWLRGLDVVADQRLDLFSAELLLPVAV